MFKRFIKRSPNGARQIGETTLALEFMKETSYSYITFKDYDTYEKKQKIILSRELFFILARTMFLLKRIFMPLRLMHYGNLLHKLFLFNKYEILFFTSKDF